jgi:hypothetical protein
MVYVNTKEKEREWSPALFWFLRLLHSPFNYIIGSLGKIFNHLIVSKLDPTFYDFDAAIKPLIICVCPSFFVVLIST